MSENPTDVLLTTTNVQHVCSSSLNVNSLTYDQRIHQCSSFIPKQYFHGLRLFQVVFSSIQDLIDFLSNLFILNVIQSIVNNATSLCVLEVN